MQNLDKHQSEELRRVCLEVLAERQGTALTDDAIRRRLVIREMLDWSATNDQVTTALKFLEDLSFVKSRPDPLGSTVYWEATSDGILHFERNS